MVVHPVPVLVLCSHPGHGLQGCSGCRSGTPGVCHGNVAMPHLVLWASRPLCVGQSQFMQSCRGILVWLQVSTACIQHVFNVCIQHGAQHMHPTHAHNGRV